MTSFVVLDKYGKQECMLRVLPEEALVPKDAQTWSLDDPRKISRIYAKIKPMWLTGSMYGTGAILVARPEEVADIITVILGPSVEELDARHAVKQESTPAWPIVIAALASLSITLLWLGLKTLLLIALVPTAIIFLARRLK